MLLILAFISDSIGEMRDGAGVTSTTGGVTLGVPALSHRHGISLTERARRRFKWASPNSPAVSKIGRTEFRVRSFAGEAVVERRTMNYTTDKWTTGRFVVGRDSAWENISFDPSGLDLRGFDFSNSVILSDISDVNLADCTLEGCRVGKANGGFAGGRIKIARVSFAGSSLRGLLFNNCELHDVSFIDADLRDVFFDGVRRVQGVDLSGSNVSGEQYDTLREKCFSLYCEEVSYERFSVATSCEMLSVDKDEFMTLVWLDDIEVRDSTGGKREGSFDLADAHVPQWEMQRLLENKTSQ